MNNREDKVLSSSQHSVGLEKFNWYFEEAKRIRTELESEMRVTRDVYDDVAAKIEEHKQRFAQLLQTDELEKMLNEKKKQLDGVLQQYTARLQTVGTQLEQLLGQRDLVEERAAQSSQKVALHKKFRPVTNELRKLIGLISTTRNTTQSLSKMDQCPTCGQKVDENATSHAMHKVVEQIKQSRAQIEAMEYSNLVDVTAIDSSHIENASASDLTNVLGKFLQSLSDQIEQLDKRMEAEQRENDSDKDQRANLQRRVLDLQNQQLRIENEHQRSVADFERSVKNLEVCYNQTSSTWLFLILTLIISLTSTRTPRYRQQD